MTRDTELSATLWRCREGAPEWQPIYDEFIARLRAAGVGRPAPKPGEPMPDFALPNAAGLYTRLSDLAAGGPLVLSFQRGGWCPYCRSELAAWTRALPALVAAGGRFVSVTGEVGGRAEALRQMVGEVDVLCDVDYGVALSLGLAFRVDERLQQRYLDYGIDLPKLYGSPAWIMPVPATFVVDRDLTVRYAFIEPDFRLRAEPDDVIAALRGAAATPAA